MKYILYIWNDISPTTRAVFILNAVLIKIFICLTQVDSFARLFCDFRTRKTLSRIQCQYLLCQKSVKTRRALKHETPTRGFSPTTLDLPLMLAGRNRKRHTRDIDIRAARQKIEFHLVCTLNARPE